MPIKLSKSELKKKEEVLRSYPAYITPIIEYMIKHWSFDRQTHELTEDAPERKEMAHNRNYEELGQINAPTL